jgi:hypothetical protein
MPLGETSGNLMDSLEQLQGGRAHFAPVFGNEVCSLKQHGSARSRQSRSTF